MATQITKSEIIENIAQTKECSVKEISNLDIDLCTFQKGNSVYMFDLTSKKTAVKEHSIKFLWTVKDCDNCVN